MFFVSSGGLRAPRLHRILIFQFSFPSWLFVMLVPCWPVPLALSACFPPIPLAEEGAWPARSLMAPAQEVFVDRSLGKVKLIFLPPIGRRMIMIGT